jgi:hypothetical protein
VRLRRAEEIETLSYRTVVELNAESRLALQWRVATIARRPERAQRLVEERTGAPSAARPTVPAAPTDPNHPMKGGWLPMPTDPIHPDQLHGEQALPRRPGRLPGQPAGRPAGRAAGGTASHRRQPLGLGVLMISLTPAGGVPLTGRGLLA